VREVGQLLLSRLTVAAAAATRRGVWPSSRAVTAFSPGLEHPEVLGKHLFSAPPLAFTFTSSTPRQRPYYALRISDRLRTTATPFRDRDYAIYAGLRERRSSSTEVAVSPTRGGLQAPPPPPPPINHKKQKKPPPTPPPIRKENEAPPPSTSRSRNSIV